MKIDLEAQKLWITNYRVLEVIDPAFFRKSENVVVTTIAVMFKVAKKYHEKRNFEENSEFNSLLRKFEKVFRSLKIIDGRVPREDSLEYLNELSDATTLKDDIRSLVNCFLRMYDDDSDYLVIPIDDSEIHGDAKNKMIEDANKFLKNDNVVLIFETVK